VELFLVEGKWEGKIVLASLQVKPTLSGNLKFYLSGNLNLSDKPSAKRNGSGIVCISGGVAYYIGRRTFYICSTT